MDSHFDCVVVGCGVYGLCAAKQYHVLHPDESIVVYEAYPSLGGTWSQERLYANLKTNNVLGTYEYPDFPMQPTETNLRWGKDFIPGETVHAYLRDYAHHFGIDQFIQFNTKVTVAEHQSTDKGGWILTLEIGQDGEHDKPTKNVSARRLIIATGLTTQPIKPQFKDQESYQGQIFHARDFADHAATLKTAKHATVFGTGKFAWDVAYSYATAGVPVDWVIRSHGHGLGWAINACVTPFHLLAEKLVHTRLLTWLSPSIWADSDGFSWIIGFLQRTWPGRLLSSTAWKILSADATAIAGFNKHPETKKLISQTPFMYSACSTSMLNYDQDFAQLVRDAKIKLHFSEIDRLSPSQVHLANGTNLDSDVIMAFGGWQQNPPIKFLPEGIEAELGLLHSQKGGDWDTRTGDTAMLIKRADAEILKKLPLLRNQPQFPNFVPATGKPSGEQAKGEPQQLGFLMYRFLAPQSARLLRCHDIAFTGIQANLRATVTAHVSGLWISAYLDGKLVNNPSAAAADDEAFAKLRYENVLHNRFGHWRYPVDWSNKAPNFAWDQVTYMSILLKDLGLETHRKKSLLQEIFGAYEVDDYRDINKEWKAHQISNT